MSKNQAQFTTEYDRTEITLRGRGQHVKNNLIRNGKGVTQQKNTGSEHSNKMRKLDQSDDVGKLKKINSKIAQAIIKARSAKKIKRDELAAKINVTKKTMEEFETCKANYDIKVIQKLERFLKVKLTGEEFKD